MQKVGWDYCSTALLHNIPLCNILYNIFLFLSARSGYNEQIEWHIRVKMQECQNNTLKHSIGTGNNNNRY